MPATSQQEATVTISARVTPAQKAVVKAAAVASGLTVSEMIEREVLPAARRRLSIEAAEEGDGGE